jgi:hypothetical protein
MFPAVYLSRCLPLFIPLIFPSFFFHLFRFLIVISFFSLCPSHPPSMCTSTSPVSSSQYQFITCIAIISGHHPTFLSTVQLPSQEQLLNYNSDRSQANLKYYVLSVSHQDAKLKTFGLPSCSLGRWSTLLTLKYYLTRHWLGWTARRGRKKPKTSKNKHEH